MKKILTVILILFSLLSCSNNEDELLMSSQGPPAFPHVFMGNAFVNGQPINEGVVIYAEFGKSRYFTTPKLNSTRFLIR